MHTTHRRRLAALTLLASLSYYQLGCASNPTNAPPQAVAANTGARVVDGLVKIQNWTNENTAPAGALPADVGRKITDAMQQAHDAGVKLSTALKAWNLASTFDAKRLSEAEVQTQIALVNAALGVVLGVQLPPSLVNEAGSLVHNVTKAVADIQAALAAPTGGPTS
jgi:hypothetical protein